MSLIRIQISEKCLYLQISQHLKWGRAENHTCKYRHHQFCSECPDPHEDVSLYRVLCDSTVESRDFILHCCFCGDVRELKVFNAWIVIYYSVFLGIGCVFLTTDSPGNLGFIFWSIFFSSHIRKEVINCFVFSDKFLLLLPSTFWLLLKKMMHLIAHRDLNPIHCKGYLCRLMHSSQKFFGLIARGCLKSKASLPHFEQSNWKHSLNPGFDPVII